MSQLPVASAAPTTAAEAQPKIDPATGGLLVAVAGGGGTQSTPTVSVDQGIVFVGAGNVNCTAATVLSARATPAYLIVTNLDPSATVYLGASAVTGATNGEALLAGSTRGWRSANPSLEYAIGSATVNVSVRA